jgi:nitroreductase
MELSDINKEGNEVRKSNYEISPSILGRWSPRAMSGEELDDNELMSLFEAARWAPSSGNGQPWRFIYSKRGSESWNRFFDLLVEGNQAWCENAAVLVIVLSSKVKEHNGKPYLTHSFDTGAAWENLAIEGGRKGLVIHGMAGFDYDMAKEVLEVPEEFQVEAMIAIGKRGKKENLPGEIQDGEVPSFRKPMNEIVFEGKFGKR